ncbi:hypothetical protein [Nocardioides ungokensis]|uniref:hypothetical protein n=1 Tax=Nocardioides ungokensis TaxID=1643322 RepID=UPI0015DF8118|nr:hypothetical protein [Nocardioides ungokensis]
MYKYVFKGGFYDGTETEDSPELPEFEDFDVDDGPVHRYRRTNDVNGEGYVIYPFDGPVSR